MTTTTFTTAIQFPRLFDAAAAMATLRRWCAHQQRPVQAVQADQRALARLEAAQRRRQVSTQQSTACWRSSFGA